MTLSKPRRIGCLHAHHSNIRYVEEALASEGTELMHFVDPGLICRLTGREGGKAEAVAKVREQLDWIEGSGADAILITCTNYIAVMDESDRSGARRSGVPVIPIDEPWFDEVVAHGRDPVLAFTNPATVEGTMDRLRRYADAKGVKLHPEAAVADRCFPLLLQGRTEAYNEQVETFLQHLIQYKDRPVVVTQLSMTDAALRVERTLGVSLIQPVRALSHCLQRRGL